MLLNQNSFLVFLLYKEVPYDFPLIIKNEAFCVVACNSSRLRKTAVTTPTLPASVMPPSSWGRTGNGVVGLEGLVRAERSSSIR